MINVLFLSLWYPNRYDPMLGLFVRKHAEAVSLFANVKVLYVEADESIYNYEVVINHYNNIEEITIYYPFKKDIMFGKILKQLRYLKAYYKGFMIIRKLGFTPDIVHANVLTRTAFIAYVYKILSKTPYVITEHWSRLLEVRNDFHGFFRKILSKIVVKNADFILPVSRKLLEGIEFNNLLLTKCKIIENVVDECFFNTYPTNHRSIKRILNVTCFLDEAKNLTGLLNTIKRLSFQRSDFELIMIGEGVDFDTVYEYSKLLKIPEEIITFAGVKTSQEIAALMQNSDFVVQFSNYESAGVVVQEALASGLPVLSTKVGIAPDYINETNGLLINVNDEVGLLKSLNFMLDNANDYDHKKIKESSSILFNYKSIGQKFLQVYQEVLNSH